nr:hypothetical protein Iba_scaffold8078CG0050 [Ipomoea batatas]GME15236.1 hypothetical protein Iba_scaffold15996CG0010 [Ipomoea batatas]
MKNPIYHPRHKLIIHDLMPMPKKPLNACLQFWNATVTPLVQKIEKLPSTSTIALNLQNELMKRRQKDKELKRPWVSVAKIGNESDRNFCSICRTADL